MNEKQRIHGPAKPLEEFDVERANNLSYMTFTVRVWFKAFFCVSVLLVLSMILNFYFFLDRKDVRTIGLTPDLRVIELSPLSKPLISDAGLLSWCMQTISDTFSFTYNNWRETISSMQYRYTRNAFEAVVTGMYPYFEQIAEKRQIMNVIFIRVPRIIERGRKSKNGPYSWTIEGYATISIEGGQSHAEQRILIKVIIERVNPAIVPNGVIIRSVVFKPVT